MLEEKDHAEDRNDRREYQTEPVRRYRRNGCSTVRLRVLILSSKRWISGSASCRSSMSRHRRLTTDGADQAGMNIGMEPNLGILQKGAALNDYEYLMQSRKAMFGHLIWWGVALKAAREMEGANSAQAA
jgi:hypothetical protein